MKNSDQIVKHSMFMFPWIRDDQIWSNNIFFWTNPSKLIISNIEAIVHQTWFAGKIHLMTSTIFPGKSIHLWLWWSRLMEVSLKFPYQIIHLKMDYPFNTQPFWGPFPSPSHHHFYRWNSINHQKWGLWHCLNQKKSRKLPWEMDGFVGPHLLRHQGIHQDANQGPSRPPVCPAMWFTPFNVSNGAVETPMIWEKYWYDWCMCVYIYIR